MKRRFLFVLCHPVPDSFVRAMAARAIASVKVNGHEVDIIDLDAEGFDPCIGEAEWKNRDSGVPESLSRHVDALRWATDLVLVYPTWYGSMPALMKGWFDRVWGRGVAWDIAPGKSVPRPLLGHITNIWALTSHGSSKRMNMLQGEAGRQFMLRTIRLTCSRRCRTRWVAFYGNDLATPSDREAFLDHVVQRFAKIGP